MTETSTWIILFVTIVIGILGLFIVARGDGVMEFVGWLAVGFGLLVSIAMLRRLANQAAPEH
ncbi:MAG: hypothetical protein RLT05_35390 [Bauldia litoralis]